MIKKYLLSSSLLLSKNGQFVSSLLVSSGRSPIRSALNLFAAPPSSSFSSTRTSQIIKENANANANARLFSEEVNIIYDSKCNVCKLEIDFLARRDAEKINVGNPKLKMTDIEADEYDILDPANGGVSYEEGMKAIHAVTSDGKVLKGVPVFSLAYEQVQLGWLFKVTTWPIVKQLVDVGYNIFAKYRTNLTRGASVETLVQQYEEKKKLEQRIKDDDCEVCNKLQNHPFERKRK